MHVVLVNQEHLPFTYGAVVMGLQVKEAQLVAEVCGNV